MRGGEGKKDRSVRMATPRGFRDIVLDEALARERMRRAVSDVFAARDYLPVETPLFEGFETTGRSHGVSDGVFRFLDSDGGLLRVRSDLTTPLMRVATSRLGDSPTPYRLRYEAPVVRDCADGLGLPRQFTQMGIELMGIRGIEGDAEVFSLLTEALRAAGLRGGKVVLGSVSPLLRLLDACVPDEEVRRRILSFVHASDLVGLDDYAAGLPLPVRVRKALCGLPRVWGGEDAIDEAAALLEPYVADDGGLGDLRALVSFAKRTECPMEFVVDFSLMGSFGYYSGLVFAVYAEGSSSPVASGGRYDNLARRLGADSLPASGFAIYLEALEAACSASGGRRPLRVAVPKGSLFPDAVRMLEESGFDVGELRDPGRQLVVSAGDVEYVIVRPSDAPSFVASGGADCGICGLDSLREAAFDLVHLVDMGFGACRMVVAEPRGASRRVERVRMQRGSVRVSTKYPRITREYYAAEGQQVDVVVLHGNIELGPMVGVSDQIVDITASGATLRENDLVEVDEVLRSTARFFASPARLRLDERVRGLAVSLARSAAGDRERSCG